MPIYGDLADLPLQDLLSLLWNHRKSGHLTLRTGTDEVTIALDRGRVASVTSNMVDLRLGRLLVEHGFVTEDRVDQALALQEAIPDPERVGDLLADLGFVNEQQIARAVVAQFEASLFRILLQPEASFAFIPAQTVTADPVMAGVPLDLLVANVMRRADEWHAGISPHSTPGACEEAETGPDARPY